MATYTGAQASPPLYHAWGGNDAALAGFAPPLYAEHDAYGPAPLGGVRTAHQPTANWTAGRTGAWGGSWSDLLYHRIWITPPAIALGNLIGAISQPVEIWNAFLTPQTLRSVTASGADGLTLTQPVTPPYVWRGLEVHSYTLDIVAEGPSRIAADYALDWVFEVRHLPVSGQRVVVWPWLPNWRDGIRERLEWATDIIQSWDGSEQRIRLRDQPRQRWEWTCTAAGEERRRIGTALWGWQGRAWAVPIWPDGARLSTSAPTGSLTLSCPTTDRRWAAGGLAVLVDAAGAIGEVVYLEGVANATTLALASGTLQDWPAGSRVYPARIQRIAAVAARQSPVPDLSQWALEWTAEDLADGEFAADGPDSYRGAPVLSERPGWREPLDGANERALAVLDTLTGLPDTTDRTGRPVERARLRYRRDTRAGVAALRRLLYARAGRWAGLWVPSFEADLVLRAAAGAASMVLDVGHTDYARFVAGAPGRRDLRIVRSDGARTYARIASAAALDASTERLTLAGPVGLDLEPGGVRQISYLRWSRLAGDALELIYRAPEVGECEVGVVDTWGDEP